MADVDAALDEAGLKNPHVREYVRYWAELTGAERVEVVSASDDARLLGEALDAGEILPAGEGRYYSRSYVKDTARSEERTIVATSNPADKGVYNNWRPAAEMRPLLEERMRGASAGKTMYVIPYLMAPPGSPLEPYAAGVELTDSRTVVLHMIRMARVGVRRTSTTSPTRTASCAPCTSPATWRTSARAPRTTSATSSPSPTSGRSCTTARPTAATRCSARSPTACGRPPTTAGRRASSSPSSSCCIGIADKQTGQALPHLRRLPERVGQDQPGDDAGARRARRPLPRRVLRRRHRLAVGRPRGRPASTR